MLIKNGAAERENRTLVESARSMMHAKGLPLHLWAEAVNTAQYILNRTATSSVEGKSPLEIWTGKKTSVKYLKIFGTECFVHIAKQNRRKWDSKSSKGHLVGYAGNKDGFRIWIPEGNKIILSRDVFFKNEVPLKEVFRIAS